MCIGLLAVSAISLNERDLSRTDSGQQFNAINTRTDVIKQAIDEVWLKNRFVGGGLRYFADPARPYVAPHNLIVSELAEAGLIGLLGLATLLTATVMALRRSRADLAMLAMMAFVLRVTQGLADIFWVAGPLTIAVILVGMGLIEAPGEVPRPLPSDAKRAARPRPGAPTLPGFARPYVRNQSP